MTLKVQERLAGDVPHLLDLECIEPGVLGRLETLDVVERRCDMDLRELFPELQVRGAISVHGDEASPRGCGAFGRETPPRLDGAVPERGASYLGLRPF